MIITFTNINSLEGKCPVQDTQTPWLIKVLLFLLLCCSPLAFFSVSRKRLYPLWAFRRRQGKVSRVSFCGIKMCNIFFTIFDAHSRNNGGRFMETYYKCIKFAKIMNMRINRYFRLRS